MYKSTLNLELALRHRTLWTSTFSCSGNEVYESSMFSSKHLSWPQPSYRVFFFVLRIKHVFTPWALFRSLTCSEFISARNGFPRYHIFFFALEIVDDNEEGWDGISHGLSGLLKKEVGMRNFVKTAQGNPMSCSLKIIRFSVLNCIYSPI